MNESHLTAFVNVLQQQRNTALNALAQSEANLAMAHARIAELTKPVPAAAPQPLPELS